MTVIDDLADKLRRNDDKSSFTFQGAAIVAFKFFHDMSKKQVIDEDILNAILQDAGVV